jgi:hypothetical protein
MAAAYTKEFLVDAFVSRYAGVKTSVDLKSLAEKLYDEVGKDKFRAYASLDADAIRVYKASKKSS